MTKTAMLKTLDKINFELNGVLRSIKVAYHIEEQVATDPAYSHLLSSLYGALDKADATLATIYKQVVMPEVELVPGKDAKVIDSYIGDDGVRYTTIG